MTFIDVDMQQIFLAMKYSHYTLQRSAIFGVFSK